MKRVTLLTYSTFFNCLTKVLFHQRVNVKHYHCYSHQLLKEIFLHLYLCIQAITPVTTATVKEDLCRTLSPIVCGPLMFPLIMVTSQLEPYYLQGRPLVDVWRHETMAEMTPKLDQSVWRNWHN